MYRMMIVEDEEGIRNALARLDWQRFGITVVAECDNGLTAASRLKNTEVDIVLTDVCMPVMDGIELAGEIYRNYPDISVVVLSGFDEFEYVRKCLSYQVRDYLSKPLDINKLAEVMNRITSDLQKAHSERERVRRLEAKDAIATEALRDMFLRKLLHTGMSGEEFDKDSVYNDLVLTDSPMAVAVFRFDNPPPADDNKRKLIKTGVEYKAQEYCRSEDVGYAWFENETSRLFVIVTSGKLLENRKLLLQNMLKLKEKLYELNGLINTTISCAVGNNCTDALSLHTSVVGAEELLDGASASDAMLDAASRPAAPEDDNKSFVLKKVLEYIAANYNKPITLAEIAENMFVNPVYLSYLFKNGVGHKFVDYLARYRIEQAKLLLTDARYKINEVAAMVGYENTKYFSHVFRKHEGQTPQEYRREL